jgi:SPP1 family predicted phage head-tail adaptor
MTGSGEMNRRVTLERATVERNAFNEEIETWSTLATVWAERHDVSAAESFRAQEVGSQLTARFVIRYSATVAGLNPRDRLLYGGRVFNITGVREKDMNRWLEVDCVARDDLAAVDETGSP